VQLASDPGALGAFVKNPAKAIEDAGLGEENAAVLTSGDQTRIYMALSGLSMPQPADQPAADAGQPPAAAASPASPQPSPALPVVVGWIGPTAVGAASPAAATQGYSPSPVGWTNEAIAEYYANPNASAQAYGPATKGWTSEALAGYWPDAYAAAYAYVAAYAAARSHICRLAGPTAEPIAAAIHAPEREVGE